MILRCDDCYMFVAKINDDIYDIYTEKKFGNRYAVIKQRVSLFDYQLDSVSFQSDYLSYYNYESLLEFQQIQGKYWKERLAQIIAETEIVFATILCSGTKQFCDNYIDQKQFKIGNKVGTCM